MRRRTAVFWMATWFVAGGLVGGFLFAKTQRRSFLAVRECESCWSASEVAGLAASVALQRVPGRAMPLRVFETERTLAIRHPFPTRGRQHYVLFSKRDIKNAGALGPGDEESLIDLFAVIGHLVREHHLKNYRIWTNGPGEQSVAYLHFHLEER